VYTAEVLQTDVDLQSQAPEEAMRPGTTLSWLVNERRPGYGTILKLLRESAWTSSARGVEVDGRCAVKSSLDELLAFATRLDSDHIPYSLSVERANAVMVTVAVPGQRWEVEFMADGSIEVEKFTSDGQLYHPSQVDDLFDEIKELLD